MGHHHPQENISMSENIEITKNKTKRDIFRFAGDKPTEINLEHVTMISLEGKRITFSLEHNSLSLDLSDEESAKNIFDSTLNLWASDLS
jgi:hypothetical protein